jgi:uncharacterized protein YceH (UPF0502 family)
MKTPMVLLVSASLILTACEGRAPDTARAATEDAAGPDSGRESAGDMQARLDDFKQKLVQLEDRVEDMVGQARWDTRNRLVRFRWESQSIERKLDGLKDESEESWTEIEADIDERLTALEQEFDELISTHRINIP